MALRLNKEDNKFRNQLICFIDSKLIDLDKAMVNLYMLLKHNGSKARIKVGRGLIDVKYLQKRLERLESKGSSIKGASENKEATEWWIRNNLALFSNRGKPDKENFSSLRPIHLQSYLLKNAKHTRDYFASEQIYLMLTVNPQLKRELYDFLNQGWDEASSNISQIKGLDVDSLGILRLIQVKPKSFPANDANQFRNIQPLIHKQAVTYCEDLQMLLRYKNIVPRHVMIEYIRTITGFHLSLYMMRLINSLPEMVRSGTKDIDTAYSIVFDVTDNPESKIANLAMQDASKVYDNIMAYIRAVFTINAALRHLELDETNSKHLYDALKLLGSDRNSHEFEYFVLACKHRRQSILYGLEQDEKEILEEAVAYENSDFDKYIALIMKARSTFHHKYMVQLLDSLMQKNSENGMLSQGRSRKHKRRFVLGTRLLETLVQIQVLKIEGDKYITQPLSIEEFIHNLRDRYGIIINGIDEERFSKADLNTHLAFKENLQAFKDKLRQIGFYNVLSDAFIMQKIRPRYPIHS